MISFIYETSENGGFRRYFQSGDYIAPLRTPKSETDMLYQFFGGVKEGQEFDFAGVHVKPGTLEYVALDRVARDNVSLGDYLVARLLHKNGEPIQGKQVTLLPGLVTKIIQLPELRLIQSLAAKV